MHNSLIMSRLKYQYGASSRLTEARGNETLCSGAKQHRVGTTRQLLPGPEVAASKGKARPWLRKESGRYSGGCFQTVHSDSDLRHLLRSVHANSKWKVSSAKNTQTQKKKTPTTCIRLSRAVY